MQLSYQFARRLALTGMAVSGLLAVMKIFVGTQARSTAVVADGFESAADVISSGLVWLGLTIASRPADDNHPYGHGRFEILTGLMMGMILAATGGAICWNSWTKIGTAELPPQAWAIWALVVSIFAKAGLAWAKLFYGKRVGSAALLADGQNDFVDIVSGCVALAALGLTLANPARFAEADHLGGVAVGVIVSFLGTRVIRETAMQLMDTMPEDAKLSAIRQVALSVPGALDVEKCFARKTGLQYHVDLHLHVNPDLTVRDSHVIAGSVKSAIKRQLPWVQNVLVHVEPADTP
ncbi:MAG: cation-efflux pump [Acidobacteriia bacterium 12-62-4]|nr:MAG: cation-efflux pump [Acidobacteriia bacterium 12-62-4]